MEETSVLRKGIQEEVARNISKIHIEGDNLLIVNTTKGIWPTPWKLQNIITDILTLLQDFEEWDIKHIYREANRVADWVANVGHLATSCMYIDHIILIALG